MFKMIANLIGLGRVSLLDDDGDLQRVQVTEGAIGTGFADRVLDEVPRVSEFGFTSAPPLGSEVVMIRRGSDRSQSIAIGTNHRPSRPRGLQPGDAGIYDVRSAKVMLTAGGLVIDCAGLPAVVQNASTITLRASEKVILDAPVVECTGDLTSAGTITAATEVNAGAAQLTVLRDAYRVHKHTGVRSGEETSAGPNKDA